MAIDLSNVENRLITGLRLSLGVVFVWFGALKIFGYNPVHDIVYSVFPFLASGTGLISLGVLEFVIGAVLLLNFFRVPVHILLILHLLGTFLTFLAAPNLMFQPYFPVLTLAGEFVFKNTVLAMAGLVVFVHARHKQFQK
ncbi:hypothetical protein HY967_01120 [Candidatus Jorgensenbacteria bacterium]|nr:hypothetical protein [Candidatus Jorgensenbacteria bacterium]